MTLFFSVTTDKLQFYFVTAPSPTVPVKLFDRHFIPNHPLNLKGQKDNYPFICQMTSLCVLEAKEYNSTYFKYFIR